MSLVELPTGHVNIYLILIGKKSILKKLQQFYLQNGYLQILITPVALPQIVGPRSNYWWYRETSHKKSVIYLK